MYSNVPGPRNGHRPLSSAAAVGGGDPPPPVPPRTYSQRNSSVSNGRPHSYNGLPTGGKSMKKYKLEDFQFVKLLGKGSFGKVCTYICMYMYYHIHVYRPIMVM